MDRTSRPEGPVRAGERRNLVGDFDPNRSLVDEQFIDSIDLSVDAPVVVGWVGGAVALLIGLSVAPLPMFGTSRR